MKKDILIDLDGVLNQYNGNYVKEFIPPPETGAKEFLQILATKYRLTIYTSRDIKLVTKWLKDNSLDIYIFEITNIKKPCYLYIDDRAICHNGNFDKTLKQIESFIVHWQK